MTVMPRGVADWTVDDLDALPGDGLRYELLDGILLVSPAPTRRHQRAVSSWVSCWRQPAQQKWSHWSPHSTGGRTSEHHCNRTSWY